MKFGDFNSIAWYGNEESGAQGANELTRLFGDLIEH